MADKKISQLPPATTPLAGTEVLPIVQGGTTDQVSVANLTAGRAVSATQYTSTIATGTAPLVVTSTTEVANLKAATATLADSATTANAVKSNATTGVLQVTGPAAASTRVMTTPNANFTVARTDASQTFTGDQVFSNVATAANFNTKYESSTNAATNIPAVPQSGGYSFTAVDNRGARNGTSFIKLGGVNAGSNFSACWIGAFYNTNYSGNVLIYSGKKGNNALSDYQSALNAEFQQDSISFYTTVAGTGDTTERVNIDSSGNTNIKTGNLVIGTSGKGIDFSATSNGSGTMTSELLADYEEGTWTPSLGGDTTYTTQTGYYVKIGKMVFVSCILQVNVLGTGNNKVISGLPYSCTQNGSGSVHYFGSLATSLVDAVAYTDVNSGLNVYFRTLTAAAATMGNATMFQNGSRIDFTLMYQAA